MNFLMVSTLLKMLVKYHGAVLPREKVQAKMAASPGITMFGS